jgi:hypothetical protein
MNKFKLSINSTPDDIKKFTPLFTQILLLKLNEIFKILAIEDTESNKVL